MPVEWTSDTLILTLIQGGATPLTTANINDLIIASEGHWKSELKIPSTFTFSLTNKAHHILRKLVTLEVALLLLARCSISFQTLQQAAFAADILFDQYQQVKADIEKAGTRDWILNNEG